MTRFFGRKGIILSLCSLMLFWGCASTIKESGGKPRGAAFTVTDISGGLPAEGLWRNGIALFDVNGDGFLDIIAPPRRKAEPGQKKPSIFLWSGKEGRWKDGNFTFPDLKDYDYGGIAVGDLNKDGLFDIILATHSGRIILLMNDGKGGFAEEALPLREGVHSRAVVLSDLNGDGWLDIAAVSEAFVTKPDDPKGIFVWLNRAGKGWDESLLKDSEKVLGDSLAVGDLKGDGKKDLVIAPMTAISDQKKVLWLGDGKGKFAFHENAMMGDQVPFYVRAGDLDGDGKDEVVFKVSGVGSQGKTSLKAFKWVGEGMLDISTGLEAIATPLVFDLVDLDGDGRHELVVLAMDGLHIYRYGDKTWAEIFFYPLPSVDTEGAFDLRAGRQADGTILIAYNLGMENPALHTGIKAFLLRK